MLDSTDTIVAVATPPGPAARAIVRLTGPRSVVASDAVFTSSQAAAPRRVQPGRLRLTGILASLPADRLIWQAPCSPTGQDVVELHTVSSAPLLDRLTADLLAAGCRAAGPGEFTLRGFLAGKLDLPRAEAIRGVIEAADRNELTQALAQLAGGLTRPLDGLRDDLLNLLADVEAGLDFVDEDITFVSTEDTLQRLTAGLAKLTVVLKQLDARTVAAGPFRVALVGRPNAGKSSLFNALCGATALVSSRPGTTRDYLVGRLDVEGMTIEVIDTAGIRTTGDEVEATARDLGQTVAEQADLLLVCVEAGAKPTAEEQELLARPQGLAVATKIDRAQASPGWLPTSVVSGEGVSELRAELADRASVRREPPLAPSRGRCRHHIVSALECLKRSHQVVLFEDPPELLALELRTALEQIGALVGAVYTDDLLDRVFSRFCIGK